MLTLTSCVIKVAAFSIDARMGNKTSVKMYKNGKFLAVVASNLDEFEIMKNYMFITQTVSRFFSAIILHP